MHLIREGSASEYEHRLDRRRTRGRAYEMDQCTHDEEVQSTT